FDLETVRIDRTKPPFSGKQLFSDNVFRLNFKKAGVETSNRRPLTTVLAAVGFDIGNLNTERGVLHWVKRLLVTNFGYLLENPKTPGSTRIGEARLNEVLRLIPHDDHLYFQVNPRFGNEALDLK